MRIIDMPSEFDLLETWEKFLQEMQQLPQSNEVIEAITEAERVIADKRKKLD